MTKRRSRGDGGIHWDEQRQRWIATVTVGYTPAGKRIVRKTSGKTKTEANNALRSKIREYEDGLAQDQAGFTVAQAVEDWLTYGLNGRSQSTIEKNRYLCKHIISGLGARKLRELKASEVDKWLLGLAHHLSTSTVRRIHECLSRAVDRAMARDKVKRNVVVLCGIPTGKPGRPSKSLTLEAAKALLNAAEDTRLYAYVVISLLTGARTEELRALTWKNVDLMGDLEAVSPVPPSIQVWASVRDGGDTKTPKSRRTLALPLRAVVALRAQRALQEDDRKKAGGDWQALDLVFSSALGTELDAANVRRAFRRITKEAGLDQGDWTPRELRHSFVSLLSDDGVSIGDIADLCGHSGTSVTEKVYRHQLRPVLLTGASAMDRIFPHKGECVS
ncbi:site-specific integrase [Winogradskya humida]|uniref:Integrase n=1 Tax=Winogradskya humida TaxID=113566 RepID=A0ABQ3ZUJ2_9ACTN|nr:tyrosine-type recombinase/integrase [Actinoplanes humidus]GIE22118.1 integrase [Actinoplanes humidus]